jgi:hypothetical protein
MKLSKGVLLGLATAVACAGVVTGPASAEGLRGTPPRKKVGFLLAGTVVESADSGGGDAAPGADADAIDTSCNFIGLTNGSLVNGAYAGGTSSDGIVRTNLGISFADATVLTSFNGCCSPDANVAYSAGGNMLLASTGAAANWSGITFSSSNSVPITVSGFTSADGSGAAVASTVIPANVSAGPYNTWTTRNVSFPSPVRSVRIVGTANQWGIDTVQATLATCPPPAAGGATPKVAVFQNSAIVDMVGGSASEGPNTAQALDSLGFDVSTFTGFTAADWNAQAAAGRVIVIPEQEIGSLAANMDGTSQNALRNVVTNGGAVLVFGDYYGDAESLLNIATGFSLTKAINDPSGSRSLNASAASGTPLASAPSSITTSDGTYTNAGWPSGSRIFYGSAGEVWLAAADAGAGRVGFVAYDYYAPFGTNSATAPNWTAAVGKLVQHLYRGSGEDCNANGQSDACEISRGLVADCNANGVPDSCDISGVSYSASRSGLLATSGGTVVTTFAATPVAVTDVAMRFEVNADIDNGPSEGVEFVLFTAGGQISVNVVGPQGPDCSTQVRTISVPAAAFNAARSANGDLTFMITTGPNTNSFCSNTWNIDVSTAAGGAPDCNSNGRPDSCELADGTAVDQNGNGVPDSCDPYPTLTLTANAAACNAVGSVVDVDARLSGVLNLVVAGQMILEWDPSRLSLDAANPGDAPYDTTFVINSAAGQLVALVTAPQGGTGTPAPSAIVSRLRFRVLGGSCDASGTSIGFGTYMGSLTTEFTDGLGTRIVPTLVASAGFVVDDGNPVLSNVPADAWVQASAGDSGSASVYLGTPTATDACAPGLTPTGVRSDGQALGAAWPSGTTVVTWTATDPCGNTATAYTSVTVDPTNTMNLSAEWGGGYAGANRTLSVVALGAATGAQARTIAVWIPAGGSSSLSLADLPVDDYSCATIEDPSRSLRARVAVTDGGTSWEAATASMVLGDLIDDEVIDVLDWGAYVVTSANADLNGDGLVNSSDGSVILANFGRRGDLPCGSSLQGQPEPVTSITVAELLGRGLGHLAAADINRDGMLDGTDIELHAGDGAN